MEILELKDKDKTKYNELALCYGTIFNSIEWMNMFGGKVYCYGIYNKGDDLIGGFSLFRDNKFGLSVYRTSPFTPSIGPFIKIDSSNPVSIMDTWKKALSAMAVFMQSLPYGVISAHLDKYIIDTQPFIWNKFRVMPAYTYVLNLSVPNNDILKRMSNERRKNISKGLKDGLTVKKIDDYEVIRSLVLKTYLRQGKKANVIYLNKILFKFANNCNSFAYATYKNDSPIACAFCIHDKDTAYYLLGGYDYENKHHGGGTMSLWEAIKQANIIGLKYFDFEGSMAPQIEKYFRGFGGQLTPQYRINKAILPIELLLKFVKRELF